MPIRRTGRSLDRALLIALVAAPLAIRDAFLIDRLGVMLLLALVAVSLDLLWGHGGVLSLGHAFLVGSAGYTVALVSTGRLGPALPIGVSVLVGAGVACAISATVAWAGFRGRRPLGTLEFALLTLALGVIGEQAATRSVFLGGRNGIIIPGRIALGPLDLHRGASFYALAAASLVLGVLLCRRFLASSMGLVLVAAKDDPERIELLGLDVRRARVVACALAGALAGLAGGLIHAHGSIITPGSLGIGPSTTMLLWVVLGGRGTLVGPALGAIALESISIAVAGVLLDSWLVVVGLLLIGAVLFLPDGMMGLLRTSSRDRATT